MATLTKVTVADVVASFVKGLVDAGEHVLLLAHHHDVHDILVKALEEAPYRAVKITGRETADQKAKAKEAFQKGWSNVLILGLRSSAGLDGLQEIGSCVVFAELDWSPAVHHQASGRLHRIGMRTDQESLLCYYMVASAGTDETMREALGLKIGQFVGVMGDKAPTEQDDILAQAAASQHLDKVIDALKRHRKPDDAWNSVQCKRCKDTIYTRKHLGRVDPTDGLAECSECYLDVLVETIPQPVAEFAEPTL